MRSKLINNFCFLLNISSEDIIDGVSVETTLNKNKKEIKQVKNCSRIQAIELFVKIINKKANENTN